MIWPRNYVTPGVRPKALVNEREKKRERINSTKNRRETVSENRGKVLSHRALKCSWFSWLDSFFKWLLSGWYQQVDFKKT
jgi:hypothetical protein